jgi:predicted nucleotide-binding protein (sugar kinase/HSP70/actin superfamily)
MRIGVPEELMPFPFMKWLKQQLSSHAEITWVHHPGKSCNTIMLSEGDACQPFKSMVRNSVSLLPEVDHLLVPRLVQLNGHLMCPNFRALPDIIRLNINKIYPESVHKLNDITVETRSISDQNSIVQTLGKQLFNTTINYNTIAAEPIPESILNKQQQPFPQKTIALLGHPYLLENPRHNMGIIRQLKKMGYHITTPGDLPFQDLDELARKGDYYAKNNYWRSSRETLGAFHYYTTINKPAGIIYLISFNCGVDALMRIELMSLQNRLEHTVPFMVLVGDEHTQQEHTATRLEAYLDIIDGI